MKREWKNLEFRGDLNKAIIASLKPVFLWDPPFKKAVHAYKEKDLLHPIHPFVMLIHGVEVAAELHVAQNILNFRRIL